MRLRHAHRVCQAAAIALLVLLGLPALATPSLGTLVRDRARKPLPKEAFKFSKTKLGGYHDPTFDGHHPAHQRLVRQGFFEKQHASKALQKRVNRLKKNSKLPLSRSLKDEMLFLDLEATGSLAGSFNRRKGLFLPGWDEPTEFGAVLRARGKSVARASIKVKPDVEINERVAELTGLDAKKLARAPRFEDKRVANRLLKLMEGRPIVGHAIQRNDWSWLRSSFARRGVDLPKPRRMLLDTQLISFAIDGPGDGKPPTLGELAKRYGVRVEGQLHGALVDADVTAKVFHVQMERAGAKTLGDAFRLMHEGHQVMREAQKQAKAERQRQKAQSAAAPK